MNWDLQSLTGRVETIDECLRELNSIVARNSGSVAALEWQLNVTSQIDNAVQKNANKINEQVDKTLSEFSNKLKSLEEESKIREVVLRIN